MAEGSWSVKTVAEMNREVQRRVGDTKNTPYAYNARLARDLLRRIAERHGLHYHLELRGLVWRAEIRGVNMPATIQERSHSAACAACKAFLTFTDIYGAVI